MRGRKHRWQKTALIPDDVWKISFALGVSLHSDEVFYFKFRGCILKYDTIYYYRNYRSHRVVANNINGALTIVKTKKYDDEDVDFSQEERFDLAYTVWEQTSQREALDYLNAHGREFFLYTVENYSER